MTLQVNFTDHTAAALEAELKSLLSLVEADMKTPPGVSAFLLRDVYPETAKFLLVLASLTGSGPSAEC